MISELFLVGLFAWSIAQGDGVEAAVLVLRWAWMIWRYFDLRMRAVTA